MTWTRTGAGELEREEVTEALACMLKGPYHVPHDMSNDRFKWT